MQSKTVSDLRSAYNNDVFLRQGIGYYPELGVTGPKSHVFYPYVDGNVIPKDPYDSGVNVPTVFGFSMYTTIREVVHDSPLTKQICQIRTKPPFMLPRGLSRIPR